MQKRRSKGEGNVLSTSAQQKKAWDATQKSQAFNILLWLLMLEANAKAMDQIPRILHIFLNFTQTQQNYAKRV